jgi:hypothetical protein
MRLLTEQYVNEIKGILSCYDRVIITGTVPHICYAQGMTDWLYAHKIRIFDYPQFADTIRHKIRENAERISRDSGIEIEHINKQHIRKEDRVKKVVEKRGTNPGLIHIISTMEACDSYKPWHDKRTHRTFLKPNTSKCLHYYFYFIDETLGLCYVRVPSWCPFRLQIYFNGHQWLAAHLKKQGLSYTLLDNAFLDIDDFSRAQQLADKLCVQELHELLDLFSETFCPVNEIFKEHYHWSIMQTEYATDIVFKKQTTLQPLYDELIKTAIHTVKPDNIATFLGRKLVPQYQDEVGNRYDIRLQGTRIKHTMGNVSIKMYDKFQQILRIETTVNEISFFTHYRTVEHRDGRKEKKYAPLKKNIYSLAPLKTILKASNKRYLEFISGFIINIDSRDQLNRISDAVIENGRTYKGFNLFDKLDLHLLKIISRGEYCINGFKNKSLRRFLPDKSCGQVSRILKRLRLHGLIRKISGTYKYYLTRMGKQLIITSMRIKEYVIIPSFSAEITF